MEEGEGGGDDVVEGDSVACIMVAIRFGGGGFSRVGEEPCRALSTQVRVELI